MKSLFLGLFLCACAVLAFASPVHKSEAEDPVFYAPRPCKSNP